MSTTTFYRKIDLILAYQAGLHDGYHNEGKNYFKDWFNEEFKVKMMEEKDTYPCYGCGNDVDVEEFCKNNGQCNTCENETSN